jgi:CBS domain-containing protein
MTLPGEMMKIRDVMRRGFLTMVSHKATVADAAIAMSARNVGIVAVVEEGELVGVLSERDVVQRVVARGLDPVETPVEKVMTRQLVTADPEEDCDMGVRKLDRKNIRHLPVVENGKLVSMLSIRDLMRVNLREKDDEIHFLQDYLFAAPVEIEVDENIAAALSFPEGYSQQKAAPLAVPEEMLPEEKLKGTKQPQEPVLMNE